MRTAQETFNFVVGHLVKQKTRAIDDVLTCQYREGDKSCAVGCLISDELAEKLSAMLCGGPMNSIEAWQVAYPELELSDLDEGRARIFYSDLQLAHDKSRDPLSLRTRLFDLGAAFSLNTDKVSEIVEWN